ncbi:MULTISPECIES: hypothetical protein [unclassified Lentimonas]|uniref:hypothetical protein n=1 Tax=unclassified Lentimonas TaxID=2630993 RepID=UPI001320B5F1|nr:MULTISPECIES: hypothetical protein [unclassified Lentimonas]CAA6679343.1 Unannotated [Lentimonas sp. CC4]CAA6686380.1 Unannotated [Lentimonas sp. CC6]CAA7076154.1 Unannotated [Lentimonas sp. CC4]CAA7170853.1 Unannotated [Lentimonas sp. CC21]CAA7181205.1 Unannotated [Lentimonas sp. CC8]
MHGISKTLLRIAFLTLLIVIPLQGKDDGVSVGFVSVALDARIAELKYQNGAEVEELNVYKGARSKRIAYNGDQTVHFFRESEQVDDNGDPIRTIVGSVHLPQKNGVFLFIFRRLPGADEKYKIVPIPDGLKQFRPGMYRFINLTPYDIALKVGETKSLMKKGKFTDLESKADSGSYQEAMMYSLVVEQGEVDMKPYRAFKGKVLFSENRRSIYIITPKDGGRAGRVDITVIPENLTKR